MTRLEVLSGNSRSGSAEYYKPAVRDAAGLRRASKKFRGLLDEEKRPFCAKTELILKAACAQYLGHYPTQTPSRSEIRAVLKEMDRMHRGWKAGFEVMEMCFGNMSATISEVERYAKKHGLAPKRAD